MEGQRSDQFEDQMRQMILTNNPMPRGQDRGNRQTHSSVQPISPVSYQSYQSNPASAAPQSFTSPEGFFSGPPNLHPNRAGFSGHNWSGPNVGRDSHQHFDHRNQQFRGNFRNQGFRQAQRGFMPGPQPNEHHAPYQRARFQQQMPLDPDAFQRGGTGPPHTRQERSQQLFNPNVPQRPPQASPTDQRFTQAQYLENLAAFEISSVEMSTAERDEKEAFRLSLQSICHDVCDADPERLRRVSLECFGSFKSGFATAGSDMDLVIVVNSPDPTSDARFSLLEDDLPRALEKRLLQLGYGARLLTRTRVPIIKICEKPNDNLLDKLREEREKWDKLPNEKKYPHLYPAENEDDAGEAGQINGSVIEGSDGITTVIKPDGLPTEVEVKTGNVTIDETIANDSTASQITDDLCRSSINEEQASTPKDTQQKQRSDDAKPWTRERKAGPLDFPKSGVGIQSDINFFNPLGIHNTQLLRCYSLCDPRVQPMVLFVKAWTKRRKINSSYSGTLSSYGYVLMVLHYLVNVVNPPVLPNLQTSWRPPGANPTPSDGEWVDGCYVNFWRDENEITSAAQRGMLTGNRESLGSLLVGFFHYYASQGGFPTFAWMQQVLSLRSAGGILTKEEKSWTKAVTEEGEGKRIQHRYLFCIEDPFELNHNVARTVTHKGIVAIRDEFRRARRILQSVGNGLAPRDGGLFSQMVEAEDFRKASEELEAVKAQPGVISTIALNGATNPELKSDKNVKSPTPKQQVNSNPQRGGRGARQGSRGSSARGNKKFTAPPSKSGNLDVNDNEAFPSLGAPKSPRKKRGPHQNQQVEEFSEISGDQAKKILEEVKMKKIDAQMESTAFGAAEAVLGDSD